MTHHHDSAKSGSHPVVLDFLARVVDQDVLGHFPRLEGLGAVGAGALLGPALSLGRSRGVGGRGAAARR